MIVNNKQDVDFLSESTALEKTIWSFINQNIKRTYENELVWVQELRTAIANIPNENDAAENVNAQVSGQKEKNRREMQYTVRSSNEISFVHFNDSETVFETERNILDIITALAENNTQYVIFESTSLFKDFLNLKKDCSELCFKNLLCIILKLQLLSKI